MNSLLTDARALAYFGGLTWQEYLSDPDATYGTLLRRRLDEFQIAPDVQAMLAEYPDILHLAVLVTPDDPDTIAVLPIIAKFVAAAPRLDLRILRDDADLTFFDALVDDVDLVDQLDELDLPQLFVLDDEWQVQDQWGPRPKAADRQLDRWLSDNPEYEALADSDDDVEQDEWYALLDNLVYAMRVWYNSGLNDACVQELHALLVSLQSDDDSDDDDDDKNDESDDG